MGMRRPVGVVGGDRAVERRADPVRALDRGTARARQHGRAQAVREVPVVGGLLWGEIFEEAGLPPGVLNIVTHARGQAQEIGDELVENPKVRRINFTGSTAVGRKLAEAAGRNLKRVVLELGGSNPLIVLGDADLDYAVDAAAFGAFMHQGQICMSARRIIVERPIADAFIERLVQKTKGLKAGDPNEHDTIIGPLITPDALATVKGRVDQAVADGARVLAGGETVGACYRATLLTTSRPTPSSRRSRPCQ